MQQITIVLPASCTFASIDEAALLMSDGADKLASRPNFDSHKLGIYRAIVDLLDTVLAAIDGTSKQPSPADLSNQIKQDNTECDAPLPSVTPDDAVLCCLDCDHTGLASTFYDGRSSIVESLRDDFYACPICESLRIALSVQP